MAVPSASPDKVVAAPAPEYLAWRAATDLRAPYRVAPEFLTGTNAAAGFDACETPLIVFINARSGGRAGPHLATVLAQAIGSSQVFDLAQHRPEDVLERIWANLDAAEEAGDAHAATVRRHLRVLVCGGDGTIAWLLKAIAQLRLSPPPAVAIMPLGTGNDLSRTFQWGADFQHAWIRDHGSVYATLKRVADATPVALDSWRVRMAVPAQRYAPTRTYALSMLPPAVDGMAPDDSATELAALAAAGPSAGAAGGGGDDDGALLQGSFFNYLSVGADAQAAAAFHALRDARPALASSRAANQFWYSTFSCTSGWFCGALPSVCEFVSVEVLQERPSAAADGAAAEDAAAGEQQQLEWRPLQLPRGVKALVLVNLQSYGGGRDIWGATPSKHRSWRTPSVSDGLIEVVGFSHGYHAMAVMGSGGRLARGRRLAQTAGVRLTLRSAVPGDAGGPGRAYLQLDGEPWQQAVPAGSLPGHVVVEVVHAGRCRLLLNSSSAPTAAGACAAATPVMQPLQQGSAKQQAAACVKLADQREGEQTLAWQQPHEQQEQPTLMPQPGHLLRGGDVQPEPEPEPEQARAADCSAVQGWRPENAARMQPSAAAAAFERFERLGVQLAGGGGGGGSCSDPGTVSASGAAAAPWHSCTDDEPHTSALSAISSPGVEPVMLSGGSAPAIAARGASELPSGVKPRESLPSAVAVVEALRVSMRAEDSQLPIIKLEGLQLPDVCVGHQPSEQHAAAAQ